MLLIYNGVMPREEELRKSREHKLEQLKKDKINPYPAQSKRSHFIGEVLEKFSSFKNKNISAVGRIISIRSHGKISFLDLKDESGKIQLYFAQNNLKDKYKTFLHLDLGDFIEASGKLFTTKKGEKTIEVSDFKILTKSLRPLPEQFYGFKNIEERHRKRYLDLLANPEAFNIFKKRDEIVGAVREFLKSKNFTEVETPVLQPLYGGALARPFTTHHHVLDQKLYLRIAPELYLKRLIIGGFERVFEIGRNFRNEGVSTVHNPEFTMLELYLAFADYQEGMKFAEEMVGSVIKRVNGSDIIEFKNQKIKIKKPFSKVTFRDIVLKFSKIDIEKRKEVKGLLAEIKKKKIKIDTSKNPTWAKVVDELFKETTRTNLINPTFIIDHPIELNPLAKRKPGEPDKAERFQLFIGGLELINAFSELNDPKEQLERFKEQERYKEDEESHKIDMDFVEALEYGMPPTTGIGMGVDRLTMLLTGQESIREVVLFPALRKK